MKKLLAGCALAALAVSAAHAQETSSAISGQITSGGAPVAGATVKVTHVPSGTVSTSVSRRDGAYSVPNLRIGGPFTVEVVANGYASYSVTDITTTIGQPFSLPIELDKAGQEIVVTAAKVKGAHTISEGPATVLDANKISMIASINRDIRDLARRDPFATLDTSQQPTPAITFAGVNPRYNRFTIDGVPVTDTFGLNPDGLPSRRGPVPLDSIAQFEIKVAPYDIREGFFEGGVVNAILKSGTNQFHATAFYTYNSDKLTGNKTKPFSSLNGGTDAAGDAVQPHFTNKDYGATISGPILKDRIFFMISAERIRAPKPLYNITYTPGGIPIQNLTDAQFAQIQNISSSLYGVTGGGVSTLNNDKDDRIVGKLDFNISSSQRLSVTGTYTKDSIVSLGNVATTTLATQSDNYLKPDRVLAGVVQLNSDWSSIFSTETRVRYKDYQSGQTPLLADTATATVCSDASGAGGALTNGTTTSCTPSAQVVIGPPGSAQANILHIKTFGASEQLRFAFGEHTVRAIAEYENSKNYDLFVNGALGTYYFDTIAAFNARTAQSFTYSNATTLNPNDAAAAFNYQTYTLGIQDDWRVNSKLHVSAGLRYDLNGSGSQPFYNPNYFAREGITNQAFISGKELLQPRFGFDYTPTRRLSIHGGAGIFGGGTPDVYVANSFSASGVQPASVNQNTCPTALNNVSLTSIPPACNAAIQSATLSSTGGTSAIDPHFKTPSQWRMTLTTSYDANLGSFLGDHWIFTVNGLYSKTRNAIFYQDYRDRPITGTSALTPDGRQRYYDVVSTIPGQAGSLPGGCTFNSTACSDTGADTVLTDTHRGRTLVGVVQFDKKWHMGLELSGSFTYQDARDVQAIESSVATSNYGNTAFLDPNGGAYGHSDDEVRYSFKYDIAFEHAFFHNAKTRIDLFGETRIGSPYSYTFQDLTSANTRSTVFGTVGTNTRYLFYVPNGPTDPRVTYDSPATQAAIANLIANTGLKKYAGQIAPRNAFNSPWFTRLDLHLEQEIPTFIGGSKISVFADISNFTNLINKNWGQQLRASFPYNKVVTTVTCVAAGANSCAQYKYTAYNPNSTVQDSLITLPSLYTIRIGARVTF
jgi:hypothetical protein